MSPVGVSAEEALLLDRPGLDPGSLLLLPESLHEIPACAGMSGGGRFGARLASAPDPKRASAFGVKRTLASISAKAASNRLVNDHFSHLAREGWL